MECAGAYTLRKPSDRGRPARIHLNAENELYPSPVRTRMPWLGRQGVVAVTLLSIVAVSAHAGQRPLWEAGLGVAPLTIPDYPGSDQRHSYVLPLPYFVYRGRILTVGRNGIAGHLLRSRRIHLSVSVNAGAPVNSSSSDARAGMPSLYPTLEIGPVLDVCLDPVCRRASGWSVSLPLRAVIATDVRHSHFIGWVFNPLVGYDTRLWLGGLPWHFGGTLGPVFATAEHNAYYYQVDPVYATVVRPPYVAHGGYSGMRLTFAVSRRFRNTWFGAFVRYDNLYAAVFENSPLVRTRNSVMAGFGVAWIFAHSAAMAPARR